MQSFSKIILASSAILTVLNGVLAVPVAHQHHGHKLGKRDIAYVTVTQDIIEIVAEMATVWVDAPEVPAPTPTPSTSVAQVAAVEATPTPTPTPELVVATTASSAQAAATSSSSSSGSSSSSDSGSGTTGLATFYTTGMGSCGIVSSDTDLIVAMAAGLMAETFTGNPNTNPQCGRKIKVTGSKGSVTATIVDTCPGCLSLGDIDLSPSAFDMVGNEADGKIPVTWTYVS